MRPDVLGQVNLTFLAPRNLQRFIGQVFDLLVAFKQIAVFRKVVLACDFDNIIVVGIDDRDAVLPRLVVMPSRGFFCGEIDGRTVNRDRQRAIGIKPVTVINAANSLLRLLDDECLLLFFAIRRLVGNSDRDQSVIKRIIIDVNRCVCVFNRRAVDVGVLGQANAVNAAAPPAEFNFEFVAGFRIDRTECADNRFLSRHCSVLRRCRWRHHRRSDGWLIRLIRHGGSWRWSVFLIRVLREHHCRTHDSDRQQHRRDYLRQSHQENLV